MTAVVDVYFKAESVVCVIICVGLGRYHIPSLFFTPGTKLNALLQSIESFPCPLVTSTELYGLHYTPEVCHSAYLPCKGIYSGFHLIGLLLTGLPGCCYLVTTLYTGCDTQHGSLIK